MEVGDHGVDHVERGAGHEVEARGGVASLDDVACVRGCGGVGRGLEAARHAGGVARGRGGVEGALERADRGGAHGDDAVARGLGGVDGVDHVLGDVVALGVHDVLGGVVLLNEAEGVDADLELDGLEGDAVVGEAVDELGREVEARRGGRGGMLFSHGVDGLVVLVVTLVVGDVGRQRRAARLVDGLVEGAARRRLEADEAPAAVVVHVVDDLAGEADLGGGRRVGAAGAVVDAGALLEALAGLDEALPHVTEGVDVLAAAQQQGLGEAAGLVLAADEARGHDAGLVGDEQVAGLEVVDQVEEVAVLDGAVLAVEDEQVAVVARLAGGLRDESLGKVVVEVVRTHAGHCGQSFCRGAGRPARSWSATDCTARGWGRRAMHAVSTLGRRDAASPGRSPGAAEARDPRGGRPLRPFASRA